MFLEVPWVLFTQDYAYFTLSRNPPKEWAHGQIVARKLEPELRVILKLL